MLWSVRGSSALQCVGLLCFPRGLFRGLQISGVLAEVELSTGTSRGLGPWCLGAVDIRCIDSIGAYPNDSYDSDNADQ